VAILSVQKDVRPPIAALSNMMRHPGDRETTSSHGRPYRPLGKGEFKRPVQGKASASLSQRHTAGETISRSEIALCPRIYNLQFTIYNGTTV
jgi:hypothetical protein